MIEISKVTEHYSSAGLVDRVRASLTSAGLEIGDISAEELEGLDQFHSRGLEATVELAKNLLPPTGSKILDIGSGLGGPSRYLAKTYGANVTGIDLTQAYVDAADYLAERLGLAGKVRYRQADALKLPFADGEFDIVWTQHVAMNIADRDLFYAEAFRVLKPGGRLAIYDVLEGEVAPLLYPVPWSRTPETSFLMKPAGMKSTLEATGFTIDSWIDRTEAALLWFAELRKRQAASAATGAPTLGLHVAMGPDFKTMSGNLAQNLKEGRAVLIEAIVSRP